MNIKKLIVRTLICLLTTQFFMCFIKHRAKKYSVQLSLKIIKFTVTSFYYESLLIFLLINTIKKSGRPIFFITQKRLYKELKLNKIIIIAFISLVVSACIRLQIRHPDKLNLYVIYMPLWKKC